MNTTRTLLTQIDRSYTVHAKEPHSTSTSPRRKISVQKAEAERRYKRLTNLTKNQQCDMVRENIGTRRKRSPDWKYDSYRINTSFKTPEQEGLNQFPHNNKKYNFQFLEKTLTGGTLSFPTKETGYFPKPKDELYSNNFKPIAVTKRQYNQDYELRTSMFGKTWVDDKRDRIMDKYHIQTNPFHTDRSNALISTMRMTRRHRFS